MTRRLVNIYEAPESRPMHCHIISGNYALIPLDEVPPAQTAEQTLTMALIDMITKLPVDQLEALCADLTAAGASGRLDNNGLLNVEFFKRAVDKLREIHEDSRITIAAYDR